MYWLPDIRDSLGAGRRALGARTVEHHGTSAPRHVAPHSAPSSWARWLWPLAPSERCNLTSLSDSDSVSAMRAMSSPLRAAAVTRFATAARGAGRGSAERRLRA